MTALLGELDARGYDFVPPTPATHARVVSRRDTACDLRDIFGWSLPWTGDFPDASLAQLVAAAGLAEPRPPGQRSRLRVARLAGRLFWHSAWPSVDQDAVFFGPDSYRFAAFIDAELAARPATGLVVDIGTGSGAGIVAAARHCRGCRLVMTDINAAALELARINTTAAGIAVEARLGDGLAGLDGPVDVALANPPYLVDSGRTYRDGGGLIGGQLSVDLAAAAMAALRPRGRVLLYTGAAVVAGRMPLMAALADAATVHGCALRWRELDPDVFGDELERDAYAGVDRIAAIGVVAERL